MRKEAKAVRLKTWLSNSFYWMTVPLLILVFFTVGVLFYYNHRYTVVLNNVTSASAFNQSFKENVDLKMYYYVVGSSYSEGIPMQEVEVAEQLAGELLSTTTARDSTRDITCVQNLCVNLEKRMLEIEKSRNYNFKQDQLESSIYVLTSLIQEYMYNYLYHESVQLDALHMELARSIRYVLAGIVCVSFFVTILLVVRIRSSVHKLTVPLVDLCNRVKAVGEGNFESHKFEPVQIAEIETLNDGFEKMVGRLTELINDRQEEERRIHQYELALLQSQINPHFLYNTLDTIIWLEETGNTQESVEMVTNLSNYFRLSLSKGLDIVSLENELNHVRSYLEIQQVRYQDIMAYEIISDESLKDVVLPKLTLQPIVENALYHGIKLKRGKGKITITCRAVDEDVCITVADTGAGMTAERLQELRISLESSAKVGFGFAAVHERLRLLYGVPYGLSVESELHEGTVVSVLIPQKCEIEEEN